MHFAHDRIQCSEFSWEIRNWLWYLRFSRRRMWRHVLLVCDTLYFGRWVQIFRRKLRTERAKRFVIKGREVCERGYELMNRHQISEKESFSLGHFLSEDGGRMFLLNFCIYQQNYMESRLRSSQSHGYLANMAKECHVTWNRKLKEVFAVHKTIEWNWRRNIFSALALIKISPVWAM
jgi:hypothetical protein